MKYGFARLTALAVFSLLCAGAAQAQVVISQVYGGGGNTNAPVRSDYIELHNNSTATVSVDGWSVQYASATGSSWQRTDLAGSIPADAHWRGRGLIQGIEFADASLASAASQAAFQRGLVIETAGPNDQVLKLLPPLTINAEDLAQGLDIVEDAVRSVTGCAEPRSAAFATSCGPLARAPRAVRTTFTLAPQHPNTAWLAHLPPRQCAHFHAQISGFGRFQLTIYRALHCLRPPRSARAAVH